MAIRLLAPAWELTPRGGPPVKFVLVALADLACGSCGLAWPGTRLLVARTGLSDSRVREALDQLEADGLLAVHRQSRGGRGRASELVILPKLAEVAAPCGVCVGKLVTVSSPASTSPRLPLDGKK